MGTRRRNLTRKTKICSKQLRKNKNPKQIIEMDHFFGDRLLNSNPGLDDSISGDRDQHKQRNESERRYIGGK